MALDLGFDAGLCSAILAVALWTIAARSTFAAVIGFAAFGLLLALAWIRLGAPDVALTEAAIGSGLTGGLLVGVATILRDGAVPATDGERAGRGLRLTAAALCLLVAAGLAAVVLLLPQPAPGLASAAMAHLPATGLGNPVTAVLMAYRAIDTLLEVVVLLLALVGVWSLAADRQWGGRAGLGVVERDHVLMFLGRLLPPAGIVVAIHIFWIGSVAPGGEFQAATILAAMWVLAALAGLVAAPPLSRRWLRLLLVVGPAVFLAVGLAGAVFAGAFLAYPEPYVKLVILVIEIPVTLSIAAILALLVAGPPVRAAQS